MMQDPTAIALDDFVEQARQRNLTEPEALEELVVNNPDLERLESLVDEFNIFEAIGMHRQEIRHSFFLKFLLDPTQSHGIGDIFLKRLLQKVLTEARGASIPISLIDLDVWDLDDTEVRREWNSIDILALNATNKLAVIIENKVDSDEHSDQLNRYWSVVEQQYPGWHILGLFLTPDGGPPSDDRYLSVSYVTVANLIDALNVNRASSLGNDLRTLLVHYTKMLRIHIVSDSEIDKLCLRLYHRHQRALDLIFERRPDRQKIIQESIEAMVKTTPNFEIDKSTKTNILFIPKAWDIPALLTGIQWSSKKRIIMFYFENRPEGVRLILQVGPGEAQMRKRLYDLATTNRPPFTPSKNFSPLWSRIYNKLIISKKILEDADIEDIKDEIKKAWETFQKNDLLKIEQVFKDDGVL